MSSITDAQTEAAFNAEGTTEAAAYLAAQGSLSGYSAVLSPTTATAFQPSTTRESFVYINITTAAALTTAMGPTASCAIAVGAAASDALGVTTLSVPAGWYVMLTGTMADVVVTAVLR